MLAADHFLSLFDEQGRYKRSDDEVGVTFLTRSGAHYAGKLRFKGGLLVRAEMDGASSWGYQDESPLDGLKFLLHFPGEKPCEVFVEGGRIVRNFEFKDRASKERFLANLLIARNLFVHPRVEADSPNIDTASISEALTRSALWLTPKSVQGFRIEDFPELKLDRQVELQNAVQAFNAVASQVPADRPPAREQYRNAATAFLAILNILSPYIPIPEEHKRVEKALRNVFFPPWVVNWDYKLGNSHDGEAAVWVTVFAEDNVARSDSARLVSQISPKIRQALVAEGVIRWPYLKLRTATECKTA